MNAFAAERQELLAAAKRYVAAAVTDDSFIMQAVTSLEQLEQSSNRLVKKAREWYALAYPELEKAIRDHETFLTVATTKTRDEIVQEFGAQMGATLTPLDEEELRAYLFAVKALYDERTRLLIYLEKKMTKHAPNVTALAGVAIGAKLLAHAGSLERLASVPSSTVQLFGAETALFRHLRDKRKHKSPKYGLIYNHPLVQKVAPEDRGRAARSLADKLSLCAKLDHFKGEFKADEYKKGLAAKFTEW